MKETFGDMENIIKHKRKRDNVEDNIALKEKLIENLEEMKIDDTDGEKGIKKEVSGANDKQQLIDYITKSIDYLRDRLECPVCLYTMEPPIYQCPEGHLICCTCKPKLKRCPECRILYNTGNKPFGIGFQNSGNKRHRYAEKDAEKLAETLAMLQKLKSENPSDELETIAQLAIADENEQMMKLKQKQKQLQQQKQQQQVYETAILEEVQTFFQSSGISGYKYWFRLKGESKEFFGHFSDYGITSISIARNMLIILYEDGDTGWSEIPKALDNKLRGRQSWLPKPNVVVLGQRSDQSYFIQFTDGKYEWQDVPRRLERHLLKGNHGEVQVIAIGEGDNFYVKFIDGHEDWSLPTPLENLLQGRKQTREYCNPNLAQVAYITLSKQSDYAVRFTDGKWRWNQAGIFDKQDVKFIQSKQIANVVFGNGSDFIVMYKINSQGDDAI